jgi:hypothetical protein
MCVFAVNGVTAEENHESSTTIAGNSRQIRRAAISDRRARIKTIVPGAYGLRGSQEVGEIFVVYFTTL